MRYKNIVIYSTILLMLMMLSFAEFMDIAPLGVGLVIALGALKLNVPVLAVMLILSSLFDFGWLRFTYYAVAAAVMTTVWLLGKKFKFKNYVYIIAAVLAQTGLAVMGIVENSSVIAVLVSIFLSLVYAYIAYSFGVPVIKNNLRYKFLDSELIAGGIILASLAYGLAKIPLIFPMAPFFFAILVLIGSKIFSSGGTAVGLCFALGYALARGVDLVGAFALMSLTALMFIPAPRILSALSLIMSFIMYTFFFNLTEATSWMWPVSLLAGGLVYLIIPASKLDALKDFFAPDGRKSLRSMINRSRVETGQKIEAVGRIFGEMSSLMDTRGPDEENNVDKLTEQLVGRVCALCPKYETCARSGVLPSIKEIMQASLDSGRIAVAELPDAIKGNCTSLAPLISASGDLAAEYTRQLNRLKSIAEVKHLVAQQLCGISDILSSLALRQAEPLRYDMAAEKKIAEELTYRTVVTSEALVTGGSELTVILTVLTETVNKDVIKLVLGKMLGVPFVIDKSENSNLSGWTIVYASSRPKFDVVFSVCGCPKEKNEPSGDTHSFIKIDSHRFMMAVCDGMGSGEKANGFSSSTISLIENFYRAGFSHKLVLSSVNNFLSLSSDEIYSAVDIAVVDLENGLCDIIKIGSPPSYIKTKDTVLRVEGSSLPMGVLEEMKPTVVTYDLKGGETVVLTSDGASDSFRGDSMADVINNSTKLPEQLCKTVVDGAIKNTGVPCDDITVAAFHIFKVA